MRASMIECGLNQTRGVVGTSSTATSPRGRPRRGRRQTAVAATTPAMSTTATARTAAAMATTSTSATAAAATSERGKRGVR
eukprot:2667954-Pyramimonas_sp.AAC.1